MSRVISFRGPMGVGKTFAAMYLSTMYGYVRAAFGDALKVDMYDVLRAPDHPFWKFYAGEMPRRGLWSRLLDFLRARDLISGVSEEAKIAWVDRRKSKLRAVMQVYATEFRRREDPDCWIDRFTERVDALLAAGHVVVVDDARFPNEFATLSQRGVVDVLLEAPEDVRMARLAARDGTVALGVPGHVSERLGELRPDEDTLVISNGGNATALYDALDTLLSSSPSTPHDLDYESGESDVELDFRPFPRTSQIDRERLTSAASDLCNGKPVADRVRATLAANALLSDQLISAILPYRRSGDEGFLLLRRVARLWPLPPRIIVTFGLLRADVETRPVPAKSQVEGIFPLFWSGAVGVALGITLLLASRALGSDADGVSFGVDLVFSGLIALVLALGLSFVKDVPLLDVAFKYVGTRERQ